MVKPTKSALQKHGEQAWNQGMREDLGVGDLVVALDPQDTP